MIFFLLAATVILPVWAWAPSLLDDARFDGALFSLIAFIFCFARPYRAITGSGFFVLAILCSLWPLRDAAVPIVGGLADRAPWLAAWALIAVAAAHQNELRKVWTPILTAIFVACCYGLVQVFGFDPLDLRPPGGGPPVVPFSGSNHAAEIVAPAIIVALTLGWHGKGLLLLLPAAFMLGHWDVLAAAISLPLGAAWVLLKGSHPRRRLSTLLVLLTFYGAFLSSGSSTAVDVDVNSSPSSEVPTSFSVRWLTDISGVKHAAQTPGGIGLGRYENDHPAWMPTELLEISSRDFSDQSTPRAKDPHNEYLLFLLEGGWLGFALCAAAVYLLVRRPQRADWTNGALLVFAVHCLVRSPLSDNGSALAFVALLLAVNRARSPEVEVGGDELMVQESSWGRALAKPNWRVLPTISFAGIAACFAVPVLLGEINLALALSNGHREDATLIAEQSALERSLYWRPWDSVAWSLEASRLSHAEADAHKIRLALIQALRYDPANLFAHTALIKLEMLTVESTGSGFEAMALASLATCEKLAPLHPSTIEARTLWLELQAKRQRVEGMQLQESQPLQAGAHFFAGNCFEALAHARRGNFEMARKSLREAATQAADQTPRFNRLARNKELSVEMIVETLVEVAPTWEPYLGTLTPPSGHEKKQ